MSCPEGTLTQTWEYTRDAGADFEAEHWWKSWDDYPAVRYMLEAREYAFDATDFEIAGLNEWAMMAWSWST